MAKQLLLSNPTARLITVELHGYNQEITFKATTFFASRSLDLPDRNEMISFAPCQWSFVPSLQLCILLCIGYVGCRHEWSIGNTSVDLAQDAPWHMQPFSDSDTPLLFHLKCHQLNTESPFHLVYVFFLQLIVELVPIIPYARYDDERSFSHIPGPYFVTSSSVASLCTNGK